MAASGSGPSYSERVIILAPTARDAEVTRQALAGAGLEGVVARDWRQAQEFIHHGAGALMFTDASLGGPGFAGLLVSLQNQPAWSNLPLLTLCR
jgi:two-component system, sensor histidine kinase